MKKLLALICLALCLATTAVFIASAASSRREIPAGLEDMYGDTSGIRGLTINAQVINRKHSYAYALTLTPDKLKTDVRVSKSTGDVTRDMWIDFSFISITEPVYIPVGETRSEMAESEHSYRIDHSGQEIPLSEYRIYADLYEVIPRMSAGYLPLALDPNMDKLYIDPVENSYLYVVDYQNDYQYQLQDYNTGFSIMRGARLHNELAFGDRRLLVPTGRGFYGHTAVYAVDIPGGHVPTVQDGNQSYIVAEELYPIELESGDEILGLIELSDGVLLAIQRSGGFELTRLNPDTGASVTVYTEGEAWLNQYLLTENSLVMFDNYWDFDYPDVYAFDLANGGLERVMSVKSANLWADAGEGIYFEIKSGIWKNGVLYIAAYTRSAAGGYNPGEVQITALSSTGTLIGRCKLLCGIEEDRTQFSSRDGMDVQSDYVRELKSITLE